MICPLIAKDELLGVINISRINIEQPFIERDLHKAVVFTSQITSAMANAKLFQNLQLEKEKIEFMFNSMGDGAIITDSHVDIMMINKSAELLLGLKQNECIGTNLFSLIKNFEVIPLEEVDNEDQKIVSFEFIRKTGKPLYLSVMATKVKIKNGKGGQILILRDVTDERRESLVMRSFISVISHKLRTPLTGIIAAAEIMRSDGVDLNEIGKKTAEIIEEQSWELSNLVNKLLGFSILESETLNLNITETDMEKIVREAIDKLSPQIKDHNVEVEISDSFGDVPSVLADFVRMQEVVENLVENAIKFNDKQDKKIKIEAFSQKNNYVRIEVADNGIGIPSEEYEKIFQKFYQIEVYFTGQVKGAGLGLALVKKIIEEHKGTVWVESKPGEESKFIFLLPKAAKVEENIKV
jgi:two-component system sensor histidine kinase VicK